MKHFCKTLLCAALILTMLAARPTRPSFAEAMELDIGAGESEAVSTLDIDGEALEQVSALDMLEEGGDAFETLGGKSWKKKVKIVNWYKGGSSILRVGSYGVIYDIRTGLRIRIKRCGGTAHADVEPATKKDTYKLWKLHHGFSWDRRPVILYARGRYVACSINTKPHGKQTIRNNGFKGQFCLHMAYSKTHGSHKVDKAHMACVKKAYNWAH